MIAAVLAFGAVVSVLAFGGVETLSFAPVQIAVVILALAVWWQRGFPPISVPLRCILGILLAVPLLQMIPLPRSVISAVSPARLALADHLLVSALSAPTLPLTVNSYATQLAFLRLVCYFLVFLLAFESYRSSGKATGLIGALVGLGIFEAVYGSIQYLTGWQYIFTYKKVFYTAEATGTYINRNHFAGLLEMVFPFLLARMLLPRWRDPASRRSFWVRVIESPLSSRFLRDLVLFSVILIGLIFSRSRMGIIASAVGILVVAGIASFERRGRTSVFLLLILGVPALYAIWIGLGPVFERFEVLGKPGAFEQDRLPLWRDTLALSWDYPWLGTGLGTYPWSSLHYQTVMLNMRYEHAHNDYLELAADIGVPVALLLFGSLWTLAAKVAKKAPLLKHTNDKVLAAGCAGAMAALLFHEIADFNLQIPANAFIFAWIAGTSAALVRKA